MKSHSLPTPAPARISRSTFEPAAPASRRNVGHRSHMWPVFRVQSSFSNVIRRKRRQKHAVQYCPRHNLFTWASMLLSAILNMPLGALRQQQKQRASTSAPIWHFWRVVGRTRRKKNAAGHCLRDNLFTWASVLIFAPPNFAAGRPTTAAAAAGEHFGSEFALFAGCGAHKTQKNTQQGTVCGKTSLYRPLSSYLHF